MAVARQPKSVEFFEILRQRVENGYGDYGRYILDISRLDIYVKDKKESINVYEDVRKIVRKELESVTKSKNCDTLNKINRLAELRIAYLKGEETSNLTYEDAVKYIRNFKNYPAIFSDKAIRIAISNKKLKDFATIKTCFGGEIEFMRSQGYLELSSGTRKRVQQRGGWERSVDEYGVEFLVPDNYQLKETSFLLDCLAVDYPYLKKYDIKVYHLDDIKNSAQEFYVNVLDRSGNSKGSLYIPFKALKERNPQLAVDRMESYFKSYYGRNEEKLKEQLGLMRTKIARELFNDIRNHR